MYTGRQTDNTTQGNRLSIDGKKCRNEIRYDFRIALSTTSINDNSYISTYTSFNLYYSFSNVF